MVVKRFTMLKFLIARQDLHYYIFVLGILLVISNVETSLGPSTSIVHNNVCSPPNKVVIIYNEFYEYDVIDITDTHLDNTIMESQRVQYSIHAIMYLFLLNAVLVQCKYKNVNP